MSRGLLAIGVSRCGSLTPLPGAVADARKLANWAREQNYEHVIEITDDKGGTVDVATIKSGVRELLGHGDLERLIISYSGHGYSPTFGFEVWLLSGWEEDSDEAIDAMSSLNYARSHRGIQIAFFADACRTTHSLAYQPRGSVIFPNAGGRPVMTNVEEFYATPFGFPANEISVDGGSYGIFSNEVVAALSGAAVERSSGFSRVTSQSLRDYLDTAVPLAASRKGFVQSPHSIIQWRKPNDVYVELVDKIDADEARTDSVGDTLKVSIGDQNLRGAESSDFEDIARSKGRPRSSPNSRFRYGFGVKSAKRYIRKSKPPPASLRLTTNEALRVEQSQRDRQRSLRTEQDAIIRSNTNFRGGGAVILGASVGEVVGKGYVGGGFGGGTMICPEDQSQPQVVLVELNHSDWSETRYAALALYPRLSATVRVDHTGVASLNYGPLGADQVGSRHALDALAEATAYLRHGVLPNLDRLKETIELLRYGKAQNPALAIIAANLCHRVGWWDQVDDMLRFDIGAGPYTPFDLHVLAPTARDDREVVGRFPMLASTWSALATSAQLLDPRLSEVRDHLTSSFWTMVRPAGAEILMRLVRESWSVQS